MLQTICFHVCSSNVINCAGFASFLSGLLHISEHVLSTALGLAVGLVALFTTVLETHSCQGIV